MDHDAEMPPLELVDRGLREHPRAGQVDLEDAVHAPEAVPGDGAGFPAGCNRPPTAS